MAKKKQPRALTGLAIPERGRMRYGMHLAGQQLGSAKRAIQLGLFDGEPAGEIVTDTTGLDLTYTEGRVLHTLIKLLHETGYGPDGIYQGQGREVVISSHPATYQETGGQLILPQLVVTPAEFVEAYGLAKGKSGRYPRKQQDAIMAALESLASVERSIYYERRAGRERKTVKVTSRLISITKIYAYDGSIQEAKRGRPPRAIRLEITPHALLVDQLASFHLLRDVELYGRIDEALEEIRGSRRGRKGNYHADFITWLQTLNQPEIRIKASTLATRIRLGYMAKQRQAKRLDKAIQEAIDVALKLGYLLSYEEVTSNDGKPMYEFRLNPELCSRVKQLEDGSDGRAGGRKRGRKRAGGRA